MVLIYDMRMKQMAERRFRHPICLKKQQKKMKISIMSVVLALATISARAQYTKSWTFEDWETTDTLASDLTINGLTAHATVAYFVAVEENKKSAVIDGVAVNFTKRLNLKGVEQTTGRYLSFNVDGPCEITITYCGATSATVNRVLNLSYGDTNNMKNLLSMVVPAGGALTTSTVKYELDEATTIYVGSGNSGAYIFGIYVKEITLDNPVPSTPKLSWNFKQAISDTDVANITADTGTWGISSSSVYTHLTFYEADEVTDNLYGITLSANGKEVEYVKGLRFGRPNGQIKGQGTTNDRFALYSGKNLLIKGTDIGFVIPELKRGDIVKVNFSCNGTTASILKPTNAVLVSGELESTTSSTVNEATFRVLSDGYVGFRGTAAMKYYALSVNEDIMPDAYQLTTEDTDYYSLYLNYDAIIPEGITVYTAALSESEETVELTEITGTVLKRNRGYIIKSGAVSTFVFDVSDIMGDEIDINELEGVTVDTYASDIEGTNDGKTVITLGLKDDVIGFRKPANGTVGANKAYMLVDTPATSSSAICYKLGNTTDITDAILYSGNKDMPTFNILGQHIDSRNFSGIMVCNGRKVIKK